MSDITLESLREDFMSLGDAVLALDFTKVEVVDSTPEKIDEAVRNGPLLISAIKALEQYFEW